MSLSIRNQIFTEIDQRGELKDPTQPVTCSGLTHSRWTLNALQRAPSTIWETKKRSIILRKYKNVVCNRVINYLEKYNILYKHQYGLHSKLSTIHPILHLLKDIVYANNKIYIKYWPCSLIYPRHLTLLINTFCYINYTIMDFEASLIDDSPVTSLVVDTIHWNDLERLQITSKQINLAPQGIPYHKLCRFLSISMTYQIRPLLTYYLLLMTIRYAIRCVQKSYMFECQKDTLLCL